MKVNIIKKLYEILIIIVIAVIMFVMITNKAINIIKKERETEFISTAKLIYFSAENQYLKNKKIGNTKMIECDDVVKLSSDFSYCSIYIENDIINVTLQGNNRFKNMNICNNTKDNMNIIDSCNDSCYYTKIYDVEKPYTLNNYDNCIKIAKELYLNDSKYSSDNINNICTNNNNFSSFINNLISEGITEELLVEKGIIKGNINNICIPKKINSKCFTFKIYTENKKNYAEITNYNDNCGSNVVIPDSIMGISVEGIGDYAFHEKNIRKVDFPNTIRYIGTGAFQGHGDGENSEIRGVYLSGALDLSNLNKLKSIDYFAFADNNITKLVLPSSIENIGNYAFSGNSIYGELDLSLTKLEIINPYVFSSSKITSIKLPVSLKEIGYTSFASNDISGLLDLTNNVNLTSISEDAFANNDIASIKLPEGIVSIKRMAFYNNDIRDELDLSINKNLKIIGDNAFKNNNIEKIYLSSNLKDIGHGAFTKNNESNTNLREILNLSQNKFDWNNIIFETKGELFEIGNINDVSIINNIE